MLESLFLLIALACSQWSASPGDTLSYRAALYADGANEATKLEVRIALPDGVELVSITPSNGFCTMPDAAGAPAFCWVEASRNHPASLTIEAQATGAICSIDLLILSVDVRSYQTRERTVDTVETTVEHAACNEQVLPVHRLFFPFVQ